jgi:RNA polymerase sigma-70 factor (ECF subfamily)
MDMTQHPTNERMDHESQNEEFVRLLLVYQKRIYGFILAMLPNNTDAEDLFQQVVMIMCRQFHEFQPGTSFLAWGIQIARYELYNVHKVKRRSCVRFSTETMEMLFEQTCSQLSQMDQRIGLLEDCLKKLDQNDRGLVLRRYEQGMKIKEIAQQIEQPVHHLYRAFNRIHLFLRDCVNMQLYGGG